MPRSDSALRIEEVEQVEWNSAFDLIKVLIGDVFCSPINTFRRSPEEAGCASASIASLCRGHDDDVLGVQKKDRISTQHKH